jgi:hypothetical protein
MRKTLLIAGAALAASIISSQAQVYSQNIVGYVNLPLKSGYNSIATPLDASGGNSITNLIPALLSGSLDGSYVYVWAGTTYTTYYVDSTLGGIADAGDNFAVVPPVINPGTSFFFASAAASNTVTYAGTVHVDGTGTSTNVVGVTTNALAGLKLLGSKLPIGGGFSSVLNLPTASGSLDGSYIYVPNISGGGLHGFTSYYVDSTLGGSGIADAGDNFLISPEPSLAVGSGFFFQAVGSANWTQSL